MGKRDRERKLRIQEGTEKPIAPPKENKVPPVVRDINALANVWRKIGRMS